MDMFLKIWDPDDRELLIRVPVGKPRRKRKLVVKETWFSQLTNKVKEVMKWE